MITITLEGAESYQGMNVSADAHKELLKVYNCDDKDLVFICPDSFIVHDGFEQTSYQYFVRVTAPKSYKSKELEKKVMDVLLPILKNYSIHQRFLFSYFDQNQEYIYTDSEYPLYMNNNNVVKATTDEDIEQTSENDNYDEEEYEEPYMGDIISEFDLYVKKHPDATNEEVYNALTQIREEVTLKHHKED